MKITCDYCGTLIDDTNEQCPCCGGVNKNVRRSAGDQPLTIEELKAWYESKGLPPYETTRFFIGEDYQQPRAFGIFKDPVTGQVTVYKNKDDGSRAIRYEGSDEAFAVNELFQRLKQEIIEQKSAKLQNNRQSANNRPMPNNSAPQKAPNMSENYKRPENVNTPYSTKKSKRSAVPVVIIIIFVIIFLICFGCGGCGVFLSLVNRPAQVNNNHNNYGNSGYLNSYGSSYYDYDDEGSYYNYYGDDYYYDGAGNWYYYDDDEWNYVDDNDVPDDLFGDDSYDFYYTPDWNSGTQYNDFSDDYDWDNYDDYDYNWDDDDDYNWGSDDDYDYDWGNDDWGSDDDWGSSWDSYDSWDSDW